MTSVFTIDSYIPTKNLVKLYIFGLTNKNLNVAFWQQPDVASWKRSVYCLESCREAHNEKTSLEKVLSLRVGNFSASPLR